MSDLQLILFFLVGFIPGAVYGHIRCKRWMRRRAGSRRPERWGA